MNDTKQDTSASFSGRRRTRTTRRSVHIINGTARALITTGGIATIAAVSLVCVFLVWVVIPLFVPPDTTIASAVDDAAAFEGSEPLHVAMNEHLTMGWTFTRNGLLRAFRLDTGEMLSESRPFDDRVPTAAAFAVQGGVVAFGFGDGTIQYGSISFGTEFLEAEAVPNSFHDLDLGASEPYAGGMLERTPENQYRLQKLVLSLDDPITLEADTPIRLIDISTRPSGPIIAALSASDTLYVNSISQRKNLLTNEVTVKLTGGSLPLDLPSETGQATHLGLAGLGDNVFLVLENGQLHRFDARDTREPKLAEVVDLIPENDATVTAARFLIGKTSYAVGDSKGRLRVWFRIKPEFAETIDGAKLVMGHELPAADAAVTALAASERTRLLTAGYADAQTRLFNVTTEELLTEATAPFDVTRPVTAVVLSPKEDALLALGNGAMALWRVDAPHAETSLAAILTPVWYEGYNEPAHVWQSSSGTDEFEPKYGLMPLIFGSIKATIYSMLFGVPIALLGAVYTSEMMNPKLRVRVKPVIELMASLPSVVLGFLAALVVAPFVEDIVPQVLCCFATIPFAILLGAYLWQVVPSRVTTRYGNSRVLFMGALLVFGTWLGFALGPAVEQSLFAGDIRAWLDGQVGTGVGGWMFPLLPTCAVVVALFSGRVLTPWIRRNASDWSEFKVGLAELFKFLACVAMTVGLSLLVSYVLVHGPFGLWNFDPRGGFVDTYVQRNALIVGFIMGFAIIPIIYTISEDALSAVPEHLRSASLGAGATPWQTAMRIIIPTAASGLFSAVMIGFGRAVGETMIVLMAAGNTPVMDWNIFSGFRTLSANIAVELPEAVKDSTHYRMLFVAALTLFIMTFILNTLAEMVRQRFRKRAFEL